MATLDNLIKVTVVLGSVPLTAEGFGTVLIATDGTTGFAANEVRQYTSADEVDADPDLTAQTKVEARAPFLLTPSPDRVKVANYQAANPINTELDAIQAADDDWYGLCVTGTKGPVKADILLVAAWVEPKRKLYSAQNDDSDVLANNPGNTLGSLEALSYGSTYYTYHGVNTEPEAIMSIASLLAVDPDVSTTILAHKIHPGITKQTQLTATEIDNIVGIGNGNLYSEIKKTGSFQKGKTVDGNFVDTRLTIDWLEARLEEDAFGVLSSLSNAGGKPPYTDAGIGLFENVIRRRFKLAHAAGHTVEGTEFVNAPLAAEVSAADKGARLLRITAGATLAGAIQETDWTVTLEIA